MTRATKPLLTVLRGDAVGPPPIWLMRQAGRYLPEYLRTRADAGSFLDLCYDTERAIEVTMQPIRRFGFDAAILFADILLVPHALGRRLWFETGEGPRLEPLTDSDGVRALNDDEAMHAHLAPIYATVAGLRAALPEQVALIGFAGAPWTVATYMIAGRGKDQQAGAIALMRDRPEVFAALMDRLETATIAYLSRQIEAGAEVVKLFDSWAGALAGDAALFRRWCIEPAARVTSALRAAHPSVAVITFPRGAGAAYGDHVAEVRPDGIAIDEAVDAIWARETLQPLAAVQGNLDPALLVTGGPPLERAARTLVETFSGGPHIFNLGHGVTPDVPPQHVEDLVRWVRG